MRYSLAAGICCVLLAACDSGAPAPSEPELEDEVALAEGESPLLSVDRNARGCMDIAALAAAFEEPEPFASLRAASPGADDDETARAFTTDVAPAGATCTMEIGEGLGTPPAKRYAVRCQLFASGVADREANAEKAKDVFNDTTRDLRACLPEEWTARDGSLTAIDSTEAMIFETRADVERSMTARFYAYPIELRKEWYEDGLRGQPAGWRVTLTFQKDLPAK